MVRRLGGISPCRRPAATSRAWTKRSIVGARSASVTRWPGPKWHKPWRTGDTYWTTPPATLMSRPPTFRQPVSVTCPASTRARLLVPPPMSMWSTVLPVWAENRSAPAPLAARTLSKSGPAVATTNSPANSFRLSKTALAFSFRAVSPVMMMAPVDTSWGSIPARRYSSATICRMPAASSLVADRRGVK